MRSIILSDGLEKAINLAQWTAIGFMAAMVAGIFIYHLDISGPLIGISLIATGSNPILEVAKYLARDPGSRGPLPVTGAGVAVVCTACVVIVAAPSGATLNVATPVMIAGMALIAAGLWLQDRRDNKGKGPTP